MPSPWGHHQKQTVLQTVSTGGKKAKKNRSASISTSTRTITSNTTKKDRPASAKRKPDRAAKPLEPPDDFNQKQREFFAAFRKIEFYVRGKGEILCIEALNDPIRLARALGDDLLYPLVDPGLVGRLGAWSMENRARAKTDIGKFILNRARATQERGGPRQNRQSNGGGTGESYQHGGDLEEKVNKTK